MKKNSSRYEITCLGNDYWASFSSATNLETAEKIYRSEIQCCIKNLNYGPFKVYIKRIDTGQIIKYVNFDKNNYMHLKEYKNGS